MSRDWHVVILLMQRSLKQGISVILSHDSLMCTPYFPRAWQMPPILCLLM